MSQDLPNSPQRRVRNDETRVLPGLRLFLPERPRSLLHGKTPSDGLSVREKEGEESWDILWTALTPSLSLVPLWGSLPLSDSGSWPTLKHL